MAGATTALGGASETMFHNPAIMALMDRSVDVALAQNRWIQDIIFHQGSIALRPVRGRYGTIGLSFRREDYGELALTAPAENDSGFVTTDTYRPYSQAIGLVYAHSPIHSLSIGGHVRHITSHFYPDEVESYRDEDYDIIAYDLGLIYRTGFRSLLIGLICRNYSLRDDNEGLAYIVEVGASMDLLDLTGINMDSHSLVVALDRVYPRRFNKKIQIGAEYTFMKTIFIRAGYRRPTDEPERNLGIGLRVPLDGVRLRLDYAYGHMGVFGDIKQFSIQLSY